MKRLKTLLFNIYLSNGEWTILEREATIMCSGYYTKYFVNYLPLKLLNNLETHHGK